MEFGRGFVIGWFVFAGFGQCKLVGSAFEVDLLGLLETAYESNLG